MIIPFTIKNQKLKKGSDDSIVNMTNDYLKASFSFMTNEWEDLNKYVIFKSRDKNFIYSLEDMENTVNVPNSCQKQRSFKASVYGTDTNGETIITTNEIIIISEHAGYTNQITDNTDDDIDDLDIITRIINRTSTFYDYAVIENDNLIFYNNNQPINTIPIIQDYEKLINKPSTFPPSEHEHPSLEIYDLEETLGKDLDILLTNMTEKIRQI